MLRQAKGLPPSQPIPRPRRYQYPTFESTLPCNFSAVKLDTADLVSEVPPATKFGKPDLVCKLCVSTHIKAYASLIGYWTHLVHKHQDADVDERLEEVRQTAKTWGVYWENHSDGGKRGNPTMAKIQRTQDADFAWTDVLGWGLRH